MLRLVWERACGENIRRFGGQIGDTTQQEGANVIINILGFRKGDWIRKGGFQKNWLFFMTFAYKRRKPPPLRPPP